MRAISYIVLGLAAFATCYGDSVPVQGTVNGAFSNPPSDGTIVTTTTANDTWQFINGGNSTNIIYGAGPAFGLANTPLEIELGSLTMSVSGNGAIGNGNTPTDNLNLNAVFTTPGGQTASFTDLLSLTVVNGTNGYRILLSSVPAPSSFDTGGVTYTVTFDGMFTDPAEAGTNITRSGLQVDTGGNTGTAYLDATITAQADNGGGGGGGGSVPEPSSLILLGTVSVFVLIRAKSALKRAE